MKKLLKLAGIGILIAVFLVVIAPLFIKVNLVFIGGLGLIIASVIFYYTDKKTVPKKEDTEV